MNMKVFSGKAAAVAITVAAVASMAAFSVGASDYGNDPNYNNPDTSVYSGGGSSGGSTSNNTNSNQDDAAEEEASEEDNSASILTDDTVKDAIKDADGDVTIEMTEDSDGNITLLEETVAAIANGNTVVTIDVTPSSQNELGYSLTIDPSMITNVNGTINVGLTVEKKKKMASVSGIKVPTGAVVIKANTSGDLGLTLQATLPKTALKGMKKSNVRLYAVSSDGSAVKLPDDAFVINSDGTVTVFIDGGDYSLVLSDKDIVKAAKKHGNNKKNSRSRSGAGSMAGAAAFGLLDASAVTAAVIAKKKKKK